MMEKAMMKKKKMRKKLHIKPQLAFNSEFEKNIYEKKKNESKARRTMGAPYIYSYIYIPTL